jgi:hypothetical protein
MNDVCDQHSQNHLTFLCHNHTPKEVIKETFKFLYLGLGVLKFMVGGSRS